MEPTQQQLDCLAKIFQAGETGAVDGWEDLALDPDYMSDDAVASTLDTLDDFRRASREDWNETSTVEEFENGFFWPRVQARKGDQRVAMAVFDCGEFRIAYTQ